MSEFEREAVNGASPEQVDGKLEWGTRRSGLLTAAGAHDSGGRQSSPPSEGKRRRMIAAA